MLRIDQNKRGYNVQRGARGTASDIRIFHITTRQIIRSIRLSRTNANIEDTKKCKASIEQTDGIRNQEPLIGHLEHGNEYTRR